VDITQKPKGEKKPAPINDNIIMPNDNTLRNFLTDNETKFYILSTLKETAARKPVGPWREYLDFYAKNQSGDMDSFAPDALKYVKKMKADIEDQYLKDQTE